MSFAFSLLLFMRLYKGGGEGRANNNKKKVKIFSPLHFVSSL